MKSIYNYLSFYIEEYKKLESLDKFEYQIKMGAHTSKHSYRDEMKVQIINSILAKIEDIFSNKISIQSKKDFLNDTEEFLIFNQINNADIALFYHNKFIQLENRTYYDIDLLDKLVNQKDRHLEKFDFKFCKYSPDKFDFLKNLQMITQFLLTNIKLENPTYTKVKELHKDLYKAQSILAIIQNNRREIRTLKIDGLREITYFDITEYIEMFNTAEYKIQNNKNVA